MKKYLKTLLFTLLLMGSISLKANTDSYYNQEIESSPADPMGDPAPIDDYLLPMLALGVFMGGYVSFKKATDLLPKGRI